MKLSNLKFGSFVFLLAIALLAVGCSAGSNGADADTDNETTAVSQEPTPAAEPEPVASESADETDDAETTEEKPFKSVETIGMTLSWRVTGDDLEVELTGPTTGWIAVGFKPTRMMRDANILIGYVDADEVVMTDQFGTTMTAHRPDEEIGGSSDTTVLSGSETGGETTIRFTIPLDSGDEYDRPMEAGETLRVIFAYGPDGADDTRSYHEARDRLDITL
jgi:hypothetical protein